MEEGILLGELRALANNLPDFSNFSPTSKVHQEWLGKLHALVQRWNDMEALSLRSQIGFIGYDVTRPSSVSTIVSILYRAIADFEFRLPSGPDRVFGPGAVYDFFKSLRELLASAAQAVLIVDPYLDDQVLDAYLTAVAPQVKIRLLVRKAAPALKMAIERFATQTKKIIEARGSPGLHDRVIFLDGRSCWVLGQSIKDAAKSKATYLAPLDGETTQLKQAIYEQIWVASTPI